MSMMRKSISKLMRPNPRRCEEARSVMSEYLDGEIELAARKKLERHVRFCDRCHTVLGNLRETLTRLGGLRGTQPDDEDVVARIGTGWRERIEKSTPQ